MSSQPAVPTHQTTPRDGGSGSADEKRATVAYRRAWLSLLLYPVSFVGAFLVGEGLAALLGYPVGEDGTTPFWVVLAAAGPALLVFAVPGILAVLFGRRAMRLGKRTALAPAVVGAAIAVTFILQNVLAYVVGTVFD